MAGVKVRLAGDTVPFAVLPEARCTVTFAVGLLDSATVKSAVVPLSLTTTLVGLRVNPATSVQMLIPETSAPFSPL